VNWPKGRRKSDNDDTVTLRS